MKTNNTIYNFLFGVIAAIVIAYFFPHPEANHYKFEEGRPWNYAKLIAPFDIPIRPDSATVLYIRDSLDRTFIPVFERNPEAINDIITTLMSNWAQTNNTTNAEEQKRKKAIAYLRQSYSHDVISEEFGEQIDNGSLRNIRIQHDNLVKGLTTKGIDNMAAVIRDMPKAIDASDTLAAKEWIKQNGITEALKPNFELSDETNRRLFQNDLDRLTASRGVIQQGQTIIDKGAIITPQDYTNLLTYENMVTEQLQTDKRSRWVLWLGQILYVLIIFAGLFTYLRFTDIDVWRNRRAMMFILALITVMFIIGVLVDYVVPSGIFIVPFVMVPVLMVVFFNSTTALFTTLSLTLMCAGAVSLPLEFIILQNMAGVAAVYSLRELTRRSQLARTSIFAMGAYLICYIAIEFMLNGNAEGLQWRMVVYLVISAVLSSMAYIIMVPIERVFGFVSVVTLIELSDTNNPILRELSQECPGTFQHSMAVGNLATDAAIKIGANEQLVRVGALYHDIGKMSNPNFFTENQRSVNPHDSLPIERSAQIIIGHVNDGIMRADKAGLPSVVKDFILQHHGKGKAKYFYYTYCKLHPDEEVDPTPFTYPGPNPQSREASLLMMADSVEAASRSLKEHTPEAITELVNKIIDSQIADGLHNDSPLHFKDVSTIKKAFIRRLMTMYHSRIVYPDAPKQAAPQS